MHCTLLHCTVLHCPVQHFIAFSCIALLCTASHCSHIYSVLEVTLSFGREQFCVLKADRLLNCTTLCYCTPLSCTTVLYSTVICYCTALYCPRLDNTTVLFWVIRADRLLQFMDDGVRKGYTEKDC